MTATKRKYITYRNAVSGGPISHDHNEDISCVIFELCERTDKRAYSSQYDVTRFVLYISCFKFRLFLCMLNCVKVCPFAILQ